MEKVIFDFIKKYYQKRQEIRFAEFEFYLDIPLFHTITENEMQTLLDLFIYKQFAKGEIIFRENNPSVVIYIIKSGRVKLSFKRENGEFVLDELTAKHSFGEVGMFNETPRLANAIALEDTTLIAIKKHDLKHYIKKNPATGIKLFYNLAKEVSNDFISTSKQLKELYVSED